MKKKVLVGDGWFISKVFFLPYCAKEKLDYIFFYWLNVKKNISTALSNSVSLFLNDFLTVLNFFSLHTEIVFMWEMYLLQLKSMCI